ncbi:polysaccharide deacetylase family protein [Vibrio rotiferianus]|uniref:polysaccharide deacetylase family protein n=1 Tax=Vibrio rotiferianus TaxID=190895 RepID=UPI000B59C438|nr:polysaccharide deacetylase family protein [Vibrio rotiferianus]ASI97585.1 hypothetical protein BSZ04_22170 [Vibrio rotiferianus]
MNRILVVTLCAVLLGCNGNNSDNYVRSDNPKFSISFDDHGTWFWYKYALPVLQTYGVKATFFVNYNNIAPDNLKFLDWLHEAGQIVGHHSCSHQSATTYSENVQAYMLYEVEACNNRMKQYGPITRFAYPYGHRNSVTDAALLDVFDSVRGFHSNWQQPVFDDNEGMSIDAKFMDWNAYYNAVDYAVENGLSLHVTTHDVYDDCEKAKAKGVAICTDDLAKVLDYAQSKGMKMSDTPE